MSLGKVGHEASLIFSESENSYSLQSASLTSTDVLNKGIWLVMTGVNDIPPHIALISEGKYYSISTRKVELGEPVEKFLKAIGRRSLPTVFIALVPTSGGLRGARGAFEPYPVLGNGEHSCLWPVRDFFASAFSQEFKNCTLVFELLALAQQKKLLVECKSMFAGNGEEITLPKYGVEQIHEKINSILSVKNN